MTVPGRQQPSKAPYDKQISEKKPTMDLSQLVFLIAGFLSLLEARHVYIHNHEAVAVNRRREIGPPIIGAPPEVSASATPSSSGALTIITPSPGAVPVAVTQQSQLVTSYTPQFTLCELPPIAFFSVTPVPSAKPSTAPYQNFSISVPPGNGTCTTIHSSTETMICATTLTGLASKVPVTKCAQDVTFSSQYGYRLVTSTAAASNFSSNATYGNTTSHANASTTITSGPSIETLTTYYLAPWQELTAGTAPSDVIREVCHAVPNDSEECITEYEVWRTSLVTYTTTSTNLLNFTTTIHGPSQVIVEESFIANVTEHLTTFSLSTYMQTEYETHFTTTSKSSVPMSTGPTVFETLTVDYASSSSIAEPTSTTTIHITRTTFVGTSTVYASATASAATSST